VTGRAAPSRAAARGRFAGGEVTRKPACRPGCGACCIALSISSPLPAMPAGKAAGERCLHLLADNTCLLYGLPERPAVCRNLRPSREMCGETFADALAYLSRLEELTRP
jgi:Fe-S-cluster containining protein